MIRVWDFEVLKQRERDAREEALEAQSNADWKFAVLQLERGRSDVERGFAECHLPACRRAKRCVGNPPVCTARCELEPGAEHDLVDEFYADIQEQRRDAAAADDWPPEVEQVLHYLKEDNEEIEAIAEPSPKPRHEPVTSTEIVKAAARRDVAPAAPKPQSPAPPPKPEPAPAVPQPLPLESQSPIRPPEPAPAAWKPNVSPEQEERINRIWADYVAGKPMPRPEPRIRLLSDDNDAWGVPPWWKGRR